MESTKQRIRKEARAERDALSGAAVNAAGRSLVERLIGVGSYVGAESLLAYIAKDNEVPTSAAIEDALERGKRVYLPRIATYEFIRYRAGAPLSRGPWGLQEPADGEGYRPGNPAVALVPTLAWDEAGHRIGRGAGWYDRALVRLGVDVVLLGVGYEFQRREWLPNEPSDVVLDYVITEQRLVTCHPVASEGASSGRRTA